MERRLKAEAHKKGLSGDKADAYVYGTMRKSGWKPEKEKRMKDEDMSVDDYYDKKYGRKVKGKTKKTEKKKDWKSRAMDAFTGMIPGGKKIEKATKDRSGGESMREKHFPSKKKGK